MSREKTIRVHSFPVKPREALRNRFPVFPIGHAEPARVRRDHPHLQAVVSHPAVHGGGEYESAPGGTLRFENCEFGRNETDAWQDSADAETVDCIFGVVTMVFGLGMAYLFQALVEIAEKVEKGEETELDDVDVVA